MFAEILDLIPRNDPTTLIMGVWAMFAGIGYLLTTGKH